MDNPITIQHIKEALGCTRYSSKKRARGIFIGIVLMLKIVNGWTWLDAVKLVKDLANPDFEHLIPKDWRDK